MNPNENREVQRLTDDEWLRHSDTNGEPSYQCDDFLVKQTIGTSTSMIHVTLEAVKVRKREKQRNGQVDNVA